MKMSCNGCRVLRKGCSEGCTIRPCLQWIKIPEAQANATVFLAKFYGRAGLINLINAGPDHLRPAIFQSLLYEACGRIVNPIYGSVGLLWSGIWQLCQAAVEEVLEGVPINQISVTSSSASGRDAALKAYDIRHVAKHPDPGSGGEPGRDLHRLGSKSRTRFKGSALTARGPAVSELAQFLQAMSHESEGEGSHVSQGNPPAEVGLELRLGLETAAEEEGAGRRCGLRRMGRGRGGRTRTKRGWDSAWRHDAREGSRAGLRE